MSIPRIPTVVLLGGTGNLKLPNAVRSGFLPPLGGGGCQFAEKYNIVAYSALPTINEVLQNR
jgi:hypothetical protein